MLASHRRISRSSDFTRTLRRGVRVRRADMMVHATALPLDVIETSGYPRFGLIVSKTVGNSVVRHGVSRKLRAAAGQLGAVPDGVSQLDFVVIRALPSAANASSIVLGQQLQAAIEIADRRLGEQRA